MATQSFVVLKESDLSDLRVKNPYSFLNGYARLWMGIIYGLSDLISLILAIYLGLQIRLGLLAINEPIYGSGFVLYTIMLILIFASNGLYSTVGLSRVEELRRVVLGSTIAFLFMVGFTVLFNLTSMYSRIGFISVWLLTMLFIPVIRSLVRNTLINYHLWGEPVAIIGDLHQALPLARYFWRKPWFGIRPVVVLRDDSNSSDDFKGYPPLSIPRIKEYAHNMSLQTALIVINDLNFADNLIDRYRFVFRRVILIKYQRGRFGLNTLKSLDFSDVLGLQVMHNLLSFWAQFFKRIIDVLASFFGLLFLAPFFGIIILLIRIDSPGGTFYRQPRLGRGGRVFNLLKFRTMYNNASEILQDQLEKDVEIKKEWEQFQKLKDDPRITKIGKLLRRFSLDELPQLWNVFLGEMSLVGPRPIMVDQCGLYGETYNNYIQVAPGISGLWQISGRNHTTFLRRAELDDEYIQRWSLWLDIYILIRTVIIVINQEGAY
jgi:Undecaprenyl-phosphate galactose phosphotransferase WbaP